MRRISIGEVVRPHEHVLFMPTELLQKSYHYVFLSVVPFLQLSYGMLSHSVDHRYLSLHVSRCFVTIEDDYILLSKIREWGCVIHLFKYGVNCLGAEWSRDHTNYPYHSLLYVE